MVKLHQLVFVLVGFDLDTFYLFFVEASKTIVITECHEMRNMQTLTKHIEIHQLLYKKTKKGIDVRRIFALFSLQS